MRTENLKYRKDLWDRVIDSWSITQWIVIFSSWLLKDLWIENQSCSLQWSGGCRSVYDFQTLLIICFQFGFKLWLLSSYQFRIMPGIASKLLHTHHHQEWLCFFIGILADSFLRQVVDLNLLSCTRFYWGHAIFFLCLTFSLFSLQQILTKSINIPFFWSPPVLGMSLR